MAQVDDAFLDRQIDAVRKGDFEVRITGADGKPAAGSVRYRLTRHAFPFGTAVNARWLLADPDKERDARRYRDVLRAHFNCAVAENAHKWYAMEKAPGLASDDEAVAVWKACVELGLPMRGHCVFWGIDAHVQPWVKALGRAELEDAMKARAAHVLSLFRGRITEWDLNNEMIHGDYYARTLGLADAAPYFAWARGVAPENRYYVNDYGVLQGNEVDRYVEHIRGLIAAGVPVGGIGDQAHFGAAVPSNEAMWGILDKLGQFALPVKITEFDINSTDEARQAADTRRVLRVCFAHPAVAGFLFWGFWQGSHWIPAAALWRKDWTLKPNGEAYLQCLREWDTQGTAEAGPDGTIRFRGFYGDYRLESAQGAGRASLSKAHPVSTAKVVAR